MVCVCTQDAASEVAGAGHLSRRLCTAVAGRYGEPMVPSALAVLFIRLQAACKIIPLQLPVLYSC